MYNIYENHVQKIFWPIVVSRLCNALTISFYKNGVKNMSVDNYMLEMNGAKKMCNLYKKGLACCLTLAGIAASW